MLPKYFVNEVVTFVFVCFMPSRLQYIASTNAGVCQANMTWRHAVRGPNYHWVIDLYERIRLPVVPAVVEALQRAIAERAVALEKQKQKASIKEST